MDPNDLWQPKNLEKSWKNDRTSRKNFEKIAKKWLKKSFFLLILLILLIRLIQVPGRHLAVELHQAVITDA